MAITGTSAAKRAKRMAKSLKRQKERVEELRMIRDFRGGEAQTQAVVAGGFTGAGFESSGAQALMGQQGAQFQAQRAQQAEFDRQQARIQSEMQRAQKAASTFSTVMSVAGLAAAGAGAFFGKQAATAMLGKEVVSEAAKAEFLKQSIAQSASVGLAGLSKVGASWLGSE